MSFATVIKKSLTPVIYINLAAVLLSGGWLVAQGFKGDVWPAIIALIFSPLILPLYLFPAAFFAGMMQVVSLAYPKLSKLMAFLSTAYLVAAFTFYCAGVVLLMGGVIGRETVAGIVFGLSAGVAPFAVLAAKDRDNLFFIGLVWMAQFSTWLAMAGFVLGGWQPWTVFWAFGGAMAVMVGAQALYEKLVLKKAPPAVTPPAAIP